MKTEVSEKEHLLSLTLKDGGSIDFFRGENRDIHVCQEDYCMILKKGSGQVTLDLVALLEQFGSIKEKKDE